jgi:predicted secreted protein
VLKSRIPAICLILVMAAGLILAGTTGVLAATTYTVHESESGGHLYVAVGDTIDIVLNQQTGSTGYSWKLMGNSDPSVLQSNGHVMHSSGIPGGVGTDTWTFSTLKAGSSTLNLEYSRGSSIARTFSFTIDAIDGFPAVPAASTWLIGLMTGGIAVMMALALMRKISRE